MPVLLVAAHEGGDILALDPETGALTKPASLPPTIPPASPLDSLWPEGARGRWQTLGGVTFVLYRVGTRLHLRVGANAVELSPGTVLVRTEGAGGINTLAVTRDGAELLLVEYPSQSDRMVNDSFIDPYEDEDDFDLVLFATQTANDEGRRQRIFATEDEIQLGDATQADERLAAMEASSAAFPRRRVLELRREIIRWTWHWKPEVLAGWGPRCTLCGEKPISRTVVRFLRRAPVDPQASLDPRFETDRGICGDCLTVAQELLRAEAPPRADAALADVTRALRSRGAARDEYIAGNLEERAAGVPPEPVSAPGPACSWCEKKEHRSVPARESRLCAWCIGAMTATWRANVRAGATGDAVPSRWESSGFTGHVFCFEGRRIARIRQWPASGTADVHASELTHWGVPHEEDEIPSATQARLRADIASVIKLQFGVDVVFREGA